MSFVPLFPWFTKWGRGGGVSCWEPQRSLLKVVLGEWLSEPTSLFSPGFCSLKLWVLRNKQHSFSVGFTWYVLRLPVLRQHPQSKPHSGFSLPLTVSRGAETGAGRTRCGLCQSQLCLAPLTLVCASVAGCTKDKLLAELQNTCA